MTSAQLRLYRFEASQWRKALKARGLSARDEDRHSLHRRVLGRDKSSLDLTNAEFDKILAAFRAESRPGDLDAQIRQLDQAPQRKGDLIDRAFQLAGQAGIEHDRIWGYIEGMTRRIFKVQHYDLLDEKQLGQLCGILQRRIAQVNRRSTVQTYDVTPRDPY
ncbi:MAG TPA: phage protein GemA/Gp16 family protein [Opitutaceae bacterium]|nr:phage protein GemA/Gp16 family protein [Opitutaceae bacterium]